MAHSKIEVSLGVITSGRKDSLERDAIFARSVRMGGLLIIFRGVLGRTYDRGEPAVSYRCTGRV